MVEEELREQPVEDMGSYRAVMRSLVEAIQHRVAHGAVHTAHVDLGTETELLELRFPY